MDLAFQDVRQHLGKFAATIVGVACLQAIVLTMNGIYRGNVADGLWLIENVGADLWVVERGRGGPFNEPSRIPEDAWRSVAAVPGVERAGPFITYTVERSVAGRSQQFTIIGYDVHEGVGGPGRIVAGRTLREPHYEMVADEKLGLSVGETVELGADSFTVVGETRGAVDTGGNPLVYLSLADTQEVIYVQDDEALRVQRTASLRAYEARGYLAAQAEKLVAAAPQDTHSMSAVVVTLTPGANPTEVATHIETWLYLNVYTTDEERDLMLRGRLQKMSAVLGMFRSLLMLVSIVIIALIVYVLTMEKVKVIATLKLIGAPNSVIVRMIMEQSLFLTVAGFASGYVLLITNLHRFPRTLYLLPSDTAITFGVMFMGGILASFVGVWRAMMTHPSVALGD